MKYLYLLIRHMFPRKKWKVIHTTSVFEGNDAKVEGKLPIYSILTMQDQFGNIKTKKLK